MAVSAAPAGAYCDIDDTPWANGNQTLRVFDEPANWQSAIIAARAEWNGIDTDLYYGAPNFTPSQWGTFNLARTDFSVVGWMDAPGRTFNNSSSGPHTVSDVYLNTDYTWNVTGVMNQVQHQADVRTVVVHELGHSAGLSHPNRCGAMSQNEIDAVMTINTPWRTKWYVGLDDDWGIEDNYN